MTRSTLFLDESKESFEYCIGTILEYAKFSGLAMNFDKTKVVWFGCEHQNNTVFLPDLNFEWNPKNFTILGIVFTVELNNITDINIRNKMNAIVTELNQWSNRDIPPFGRITVIKTLALSKIVHILISLPSPSAALLNEINNIFFDFLWNGKPDPIKRSIAKLKLDKGGLGMIDIRIFDEALKITWLKKFYTTSASWKILIDKKYPFIKNIQNFGDKYQENNIKEIKNKFWSQVLYYFFAFDKKYSYKSKEEAEATSFMYNTNIKIGKNVIKNQKLISSNIFAIHQLKENNRFLSLEDLNEKLQTPLNFLEYNSIVNSVKIFLKKYSKLPSSETVEFSPALNKIMINKKGSSLIYQEMIKIEQEYTGYNRWSKITDLSKNNWILSFTKLKTSTYDKKLIWLQFRVLHSILTTNRSVSKYKVDQDSKCSFCGAHSETIIHLFWDCTFAQSFWSCIASMFNKRCTNSKNFKFTKNLVIFGKCEVIKTDKICDFIILLAKFYIYRCKVQNQPPRIRTFMSELYERYTVEKLIYKNSIEFRNNWAPYLALFSGILS